MFFKTDHRNLPALPNLMVRSRALKKNKLEFLYEKPWNSFILKKVNELLQKLVVFFLDLIFKKKKDNEKFPSL